MATLDVVTVTGHIVSELDVGDVPDGDVPDDDVVDVRLRTVSGDARVHRA